MSDASQLVGLEAAVYARLKLEARSQLLRNPGARGVTPTSLVHEACARLLRPGGDGWEDTLHFRAAVAVAMRHVLVDRARHHGAVKRGGGQLRVTLQGLGAEAVDLEVLALDQALDLLCAIDPEGGQVVQLRFFGGLSNPEIAEVMGLSLRAVERSWRGARAWLATRLTTV